MLALALLTAACATATPQPLRTAAGDPPALPAGDPAVSASAPATRGAGSLAGYLNSLRRASCPEGTKRESGEAIAIDAQPVPLWTLDPSRRNIGELSFVGGFALSSPHSRFGGWSGLDVLPDGNLLALSDEGAFLWLDLSPADLATPIAARIAPLHDEGGKVLSGKLEADSEGLAVVDGLALVSFERDHRVLAYDIGRCGAAARGANLVRDGRSARIADLYAANGWTIDPNKSLEALAVSPDWFMFLGVETQQEGAAPLSARPIESPPEFSLRTGKGEPDLVDAHAMPAANGRDIRLFTLHRGRPSLTGAVITMDEVDLERVADRPTAGGETEIDARARTHFRIRGERRLASFGALNTLDNYEGLAARKLPDGRIRLYMISDDNFAKGAQRTLLMVFDLAK